jgi:hypothetical protein
LQKSIKNSVSLNLFELLLQFKRMHIIGLFFSKKAVAKQGPAVGVTPVFKPMTCLVPNNLLVFFQE